MLERCMHDRMSRHGLALHCDRCGRAVEWNGTRYVLTRPADIARPAPWLRRAADGELPASDRTAGR